jgi:hypothetical protein
VVTVCCHLIFFSISNKNIGFTHQAPCFSSANRETQRIQSHSYSAAPICEFTGNGYFFNPLQQFIMLWIIIQFCPLPFLITIVSRRGNSHYLTHYANWPGLLMRSDKKIFYFASLANPLCQDSCRL